LLVEDLDESLLGIADGQVLGQRPVGEDRGEIVARLRAAASTSRVNVRRWAPTRSTAPTTHREQ
jgi:hypothetical protein